MKLVFLITILNYYTSAYDYEKYCEIPCVRKTGTSTHTVCNRKAEKCKPIAGCDAIPMTAHHRQQVLDTHNKLRNMFAGGLEKRTAKTVSNMMMIEYDDELEFISTCHSNICLFDHDQCRRTAKHKFVGQNLYWASESRHDYDLNLHVVQGITQWYDEIADFDPQGYDRFIDNEKIVIAHFTQVIWATSSLIGCSLSMKSDKEEFYYGCNYAPGGNILKAPVVKWGPPRSECPKNATAQSKYEYLCGYSASIKSSYLAIQSWFALVALLYTIHLFFC